MFLSSRFLFSALVLLLATFIAPAYAQLQLDVSASAPSDPFTDDGGILANIAGGQGPYTVTLNGATQAGPFPNDFILLEGLAAGTYQLTVTDGGGQSAQASTIVVDNCFTTYTPADCDEDPSGYFYCSGTGEIIPGGSVAVTSAGGSPVVVTADGSEGFYKFLIDESLGDTYTIAVTVPAGFTLDTRRLSSTPYEVTDNFPRNQLGGADAGANGTVDDADIRDSDPEFNTFFMTLVYDGSAGEGPVTLNNIPLLCSVPIEANAKASCDPAMDMTNTATEGEYFIQVGDVTTANGGSVEVSVAGVTQTFDTEDAGQAPLVFGPFANSATGGDFQTVTLTSDDLQSTETIDVPEAICDLLPINEAGVEMLNGTGYFCEPSSTPDFPSGAIVAQAEPGTFLSGGTSGRKQQYILLSTDSTIVAVNMTGVFRGLVSDDYIVYAINYRTDETDEVETNLVVGGDFTEFTAARRGAPSAVNGNCFILCGPVDITVEPCMSIGSTIFTDNDNDGLFEPNANETGIADVTVILTNVTTGVMDTTVTDADGNYYFGGLAEGDYTVTIPAAEFNIDPVTDGGLGTLSDYRTSSTPTTFEGDDDTDGNDNGIQAGGEGTDVVSATITLAGGTEPIDGPGTMQENTDAVGGLGGEQDNNANDPQEDANGNMTVDFGFVRNASIGSLVFVDGDNNGQYVEADPGDTPLADVQVVLLQDDGAGNFVEVNVGPDGRLGTADDGPGGVTTGADGTYLFTGLPFGDYQVQLPVENFGPSGGARAFTTSSTPTVDTDAGAANIDNDDNGIQAGGSGTVIVSPTITLSPGDEPTGAAESGAGGDQDDDAAAGFNDANGDMTFDFGLVPEVSLGSTVYFDMNADGVQDPTDPQEFGIAGVTVELLQDVDMNGIIEGDELTAVATEVTDSDGNYFFGGLPSGDYVVRIPTAPADAPTNTSGPGEVLTDTGASGGDDLADVGTQDAATGVTTSPIIMLRSGDEPAGAEENALAGGAQDDGSALADASGDMTVDFGFVPALSVGSTVFLDADNDGRQGDNDPLEPGIEGATVNLYFDADMDGALDADELATPIATTMSGPNGAYLFEMLTPGNYQVGVVPVAGSVATVASGSVPVPAGTNDDGGNDGIQPGGPRSESLSGVFDLMTGQEPLDAEETGSNGMIDAMDANGNMTIDFGFVPTNSLGSTVFYDQNDDGVQAEPGTDQAIYEVGIGGIEVVLLIDDDNNAATPAVEVGRDTTDADGNYFFNGLPNGTYQVQIPDVPTGAPTNSTGQDTGDATDNNDNGAQDGGIGTATISAPFELLTGTEPINGTGPDEESAQGNLQDDVDGEVDANGNMTIDFGFVPNMAIGSQVFYDVDGDGVQNQMDAREGGIEGARITLLVEDPDNLGQFIVAPGIAPRVTGPDGLYLFGDLAPGNYRVQVEPSPRAPVSSGPALAPTAPADGANRGTQAGGAGTLVLSDVIMLRPGAYVNDVETAPGGDQDNGPFAEANGLLKVDFAFEPVYDLALRKTLAPGSGLPIPGEQIVFDVTVFNQGSLEVFDVDVTDYLPAGTSFVSVATPATTLQGNPATFVDNMDGSVRLENLPGDDSVTYRITLLVDDPFTGSIPLINEAEISGFDNDEDDTNTAPTDVDSTPDDTQGNDPGNEPGTASDDSIDGDGANGGGAPGDEDADTDEDDSDVALVSFLDLGLTKSLNAAASTIDPATGRVSENDIVVFDVNVQNLGSETVTDVGVIDYSPCGLDFDETAQANIDAGWVPGTDANGGTAYTTTVAGPIAAGEGQIVPIAFRVRTTGQIDGADVSDGLPACPVGVTDPFLNVAEITGQSDVNGNPIPASRDINSSADDDPTNDAGGLVNTNSDNAINGDGTGAPGDGNAATDENDSDPGNLNYFDVALVKQIDEAFAAPPYIFGAVVKFDIQIQSQGDILTNEVTVEEYLPTGLEYDVALDPENAEWTLNGDRLTRTLDFSGAPLGFRELSDVVSVYLRVVPADPFTDEAYTNQAEISSAVGLIPDGAGGTIATTLDQDGDSVFNTDREDNGGGAPDTPSDDTFGGNGTGAPGDETATADQDNADPALVQVAAQSLGSTVFLDANNNGLLDVDDEAGIPSVPVILFQDDGMGTFREVETGPDGLLGTADDAPGGTVTDADGNYFFGQLPPGDYYVEVPEAAFTDALSDAPISSNATTSGYVEPDSNGDVDNDDDGTQDGGAGTVARSNTISLIPNMEPENEVGQGGDQDVAISDVNGNMTLDLGFFAPVSVGNRVFVDLDEDGTLSPGDAALPGVGITLIDATTGLAVATDAEGNTYNPRTVSDANGEFTFGNLAPGDYSVIFDLADAPNGALYDYTLADRGGDEAGDSDATGDPTLDASPSNRTGFLSSGTNFDDLDAGVICAISVAVPANQTICSNRTIDLTNGTEVTPSPFLDAFWTSTGDGTFLNAAGAELVTPFAFGTAATYVPGPADATNGELILRLTTEDPGALFPASTCGPISAELIVTILRVDCGSFFWDGE